MLISREKRTHTDVLLANDVNRTRPQCRRCDNERHTTRGSVSKCCQENAKWQTGKNFAQENSLQLSHAFVDGHCREIEFGASVVCHRKQKKTSWSSNHISYVIGSFNVAILCCWHALFPHKSSPFVASSLS